MSETMETKSLSDQEMDAIVSKERKDFRDVEHVAGDKLKKILDDAAIARGLDLKEEFKEELDKAKEVYESTESEMAEQGKWNETLKKVFKIIKEKNRPGMVIDFYAHTADRAIGLSAEDFAAFIRFLEKKYEVINFKGGYTERITIVDGSTTMQYGDGKYINLPETDIFFLIKSNGLSVLKLDNENISKFNRHKTNQI